MQSEVSVRLADDQEFRFDLTSAEPMAHEAGRRWLDDQFTALDCEPLRASGKVLLADKVLTVAQAARPGDHVVCMSNGGFGGIHTRLLETLANQPL